MLLTRHNEPAGRVLLWEPDVSKRLGDPTFIMKRTLENDTGLESNTRSINHNLTQSGKGGERQSVTGLHQMQI